MRNVNLAFAKMKAKFKDTRKVMPLDWFFLCGILTILFVSYIYGDIMYTVRHGVNVWTTIEEGKFFNYYSFNYDVPSSPLYPLTSPMYDFPIYIVFAVWNFPLWILERFFSVDIFTSLGCLLYMKAMLLPFLFGSAWVLRKISKLLGMRQSQTAWMTFMFLSSGFVLSSIFVMTQYDIIMMFFLLLGLYMYMRNDMKYFLLFFSIAASFKMFALLVFFPLVLLKHKKFLKILLYFFVPISFVALVKIPFIFDQGQKVSANGLIISMVTNNILPLGLAGVNVYIAAFIGLCIFCYVKTTTSPSEQNQYSMYIPLLSLALFFLFTPAYPYWFILLTPFLPTVIFQNRKHFKLNLVLDTVASCSMILLQQIVYWWCYGITTIQPMLLPKIFGAVETMKEPISVYSLFSAIGEQERNAINPALGAVFFVCLIAILIINFPRTETVLKGADDSIVIERSVIWFRLFAAGGLCFLPILVYFASMIWFGVTN